MTAFKEKLDQELGEAPRFTESLQEDILRQVQHEKKSKTLVLSIDHRRHDHHVSINNRNRSIRADRANATCFNCSISTAAINKKNIQ